MNMNPNAQPFLPASSNPSTAASDEPINKSAIPTHKTKERKNPSDPSGQQKLLGRQRVQRRRGHAKTEYQKEKSSIMRTDRQNERGDQKSSVEVKHDLDQQAQQDLKKETGQIDCTQKKQRRRNRRRPKNKETHNGASKNINEVEVVSCAGPHVLSHKQDRPDANNASATVNIKRQTFKKQRARIRSRKQQMKLAVTDNLDSTVSISGTKPNDNQSQNDGLAPTDEFQTQDEMELNFPMLSNPLNTDNSNVTNAHCFWSDRLNNRHIVASPVEQNQSASNMTQEEETQSPFYGESNVPLTILSSTVSSNDDPNENRVDDLTLNSAHISAKPEQQQQTDIKCPPPKNVNNQMPSLSNVKVKWNEAQLSRMRKRWWEAERMKRQIEKERKDTQSQLAALDIDSAGSTSESSCSSIFETCEDEDSMEPPSLNNHSPYDESTIPAHVHSKNHNVDPVYMSHVSPFYRQVIQLQETCLKSQQPLHYLIRHYYSLKQQQHLPSNEVPNVSTEAETVLSRLLELDSEKVDRWTSTTIDFYNFVPNHEKILPNGLLSVNSAALPPLHLAIVLDLPQLVRILLARQPSKRGLRNFGVEEDEVGRTPLMLACQLHRLECLDALLTLTTKPRLDHREYNGGNSAYHFCSIGNLSGDEASSDCDSAAADTMELLLSKTPYPLQRRVLLSVNNHGQSLLHLACASRDLHLVDCILGQLASRGGSFVTKALHTKDRKRHVPFISAIVADARDIAMHLLVSRHANRSDFSSWFESNPLTIASSNNSIEMVRMLLEIGYHTKFDINRALFQIVQKKHFARDTSNEYNDKRCEIIRALIEYGANPHSVVVDDFRSSSAFGETSPDSSLTVAACSGDIRGVKAILDSYILTLPSVRSARRCDPLLRLQPESYFRTIEEREDSLMDSSLQSALVNSLFQYWRDQSISSAVIALLMYRRGVSMSHKSMQWLTTCLQMEEMRPPPFTCNQTPSKIIQILSEFTPDTYCTAISTRSVNWSKVLATLDILPVNRVSCPCLWQILRDKTTQLTEDQKQILHEDEFYLVVENEQIIAHKSIVSSKSGKLGAAIHFEAQQASNDTDRLVVQIDLPLAVAKMLLCHIYHGSIVYGLKTAAAPQFYQILELALIAEEYICPSLITECEMRLLKHGSRECICRNCSDACTCRADQCGDLDKHVQPRINYGLTECYEYKTWSYIDTPCSGLITPETALDALAFAQQLEESSSSAAQHRLYIDCAKESMETVYSPFVAIKIAAISIILQNFKSVIGSDSFSQHALCDKVEPSETLDSDDHAFMLLSLCLEELKHNPFTKKDNQRITSEMSLKVF